MENRQPAYPGTTVPGLRTSSSTAPAGPRRRRRRPGAPAAVVGLLAITALALTACGGPATGAGDPTGEPQRGGTLTYATGDQEPPCLDPIVSGGVPQALASTQYLEPLFHQDEEGEIGPWLAESWEWSEDRLALDITVRDDVTFTDGQQLNAETIQKNVEYIKDPETLSNTGRLAIEKVESVEIVDEFTARLYLSAPDNALLEHFSQVWVPIQSQKALARGMEANCLSPVGTGPFKVESWEKQRQVVLVRNDDYQTAPPGAGHTGPAYLDRIIWRFLPDDANRFSALQAGEVDVIDVIQPQDAIAADADPALDTLIGSRPGHIVSLDFNTTRQPFDDLRVREAFVRAVDVDAALKSIFLGTVDRSNSVLSSITNYTLQQPEVFATDVQKANDLLDEAGWTERDGEGFRTKDGKRLSATVIQADWVLIPVPVLEQFQASAKEVGFELLISQEEASTFSEKWYGWDYDLLPLYYTKNSPAVLNLVNDSSQFVPGDKTSYHSNANGLDGPAADEIDRHLRIGAATPSEQKRRDSYTAAQDVIHSQYLNLPIFDQQTRLGFRSDVEGVRLISPLGMPTFYDTWLDRS